MSPASQTVDQHEPSISDCGSTWTQHLRLWININPASQTVVQHEPSVSDCRSTWTQRLRLRINMNPASQNVDQHDPRVSDCGSTWTQRLRRRININRSTWTQVREGILKSSSGPQQMSNKHNALNKCWFDVGKSSAMPAQHKFNNGVIFFVFCVIEYTYTEDSLYLTWQYWQEHI